VKTDNPGQGFIYQGKDEKRPGRGLRWRLPLLLAALLAAHFLNLFMNWTVIRRELMQKPAYHTPEYTFLGFAPLNEEKIAAAQRLPNAAPSGRVFVTFDLLHQAVFMLWNNGGDGDFFDLGPFLAAVPAGTSRVSLFPGAVFLLQHGERAVARNYGGSIFGGVWAKWLGINNNGGKSAERGMPGSFIAKQEPAAASLRVPYLVYFYLPLAIIVILMVTYGTAMAASFFYFAGMFFLFDFQKLFVTVPLSRLFVFFKIEPADSWTRVLAVALALLFLAAAAHGLWRWKNSEMPAGGKWIVWFFILLPLFLFF